MSKFTIQLHEHCQDCNRSVTAVAGQVLLFLFIKVK